MRRYVRRGETAIGAFILLVATAAPRLQAQRTKAARATTPARVAVVGADYAFTQLPTALSPGPTLFSFENRGTKRHEMSITLLKAGVTIDVLTRAENRLALAGRAVSDSIVGLLIARPGERAGGQLYVDLIPGRTYAVVCTLKDTPEAQPHLELGMVGSFRVR